jgi:hypothetical protein
MSPDISNIISTQVLFFVEMTKGLFAAEEISHKSGFVASKARPYEVLPFSDHLQAR